MANENDRGAEAGAGFSAGADTEAAAGVGAGVGAMPDASTAMPHADGALGARPASMVPYGTKPRGRMPVSERAKIFIPFNPLKGFQEALREKEREVEAMQRPTLSDDRRAEIDAALAAVQPGSPVRIAYYDDGFLRTVEGAVEASIPDDFDMTGRRRTLRLNGQRIAFEDIYEVTAR